VAGAGVGTWTDSSGGNRVIVGGGGVMSFGFARRESETPALGDTGGETAIDSGVRKTTALGKARTAIGSGEDAMGAVSGTAPEAEPRLTAEVGAGGGGAASPGAARARSLRTLDAIVRARRPVTIPRAPPATTMTSAAVAHVRFHSDSGGRTLRAGTRTG
jgi:hypothetical protein